MKLYFTLSLLLCTCFSIAQPLPPRKLAYSIFKYKPRTKIDFDKPGNYDLVIQIQKSEIDPSSPLDIDIYFSGYGEIRGSKIFFSNEENIFNDESSYVLTDLGSNNKDPFYWGYTKQSIKGEVSRFVIGLQGAGTSDPNADKDWKVATPFIDLPSAGAESDSTNFLILTELKLGTAPISIHLGDCSKNYGNHNFTIVFTYFNGKEWKGQSKTLSYHINNPIESHPVWTWIAGIIAFFITVLGIVPAIYAIGKKSYEWVLNKLIKQNKAAVKAKKAAK